MHAPTCQCCMRRQRRRRRRQRRRRRRRWWRRRRQGAGGVRYAAGGRRGACRRWEPQVCSAGGRRADSREEGCMGGGDRGDGVGAAARPRRRRLKPGRQHAVVARRRRMPAHGWRQHTLRPAARACHPLHAIHQRLWRARQRQSATCAAGGAAATRRTGARGRHAQRGVDVQQVGKVAAIGAGYSPAAAVGAADATAAAKQVIVNVWQHATPA